MNAVRIVTYPVAEHITVEEARQHLHANSLGDVVPDHDQSEWLTRAIVQARDYCEGWTGRTIAPRTLELVADAFDSPLIELPFGPVTGVVSVTYTGADGIATPAAYEYVDAYEAIVAPYGAVWPTVSGLPGAVRVRYEAGYGLPDESPTVNPLPEAIRGAMLLLIGHYDLNREAAAPIALGEIPLGVHALLTPYRLRRATA